jgi:hypothetical protein
MKVVITESRLEKVITDYLDDVFTPDDRWERNNESQYEVKNYGETFFFVEGDEAYVYYGCNANAGPEDEYFAPYGLLHKYECPLLMIYPYMAQKLNSIFGDIWKPIFKKWFEEHSGLEVVQLTTNFT